MNDWWWLADKLAWYITWYKVAHFQLMGGYHVNLDMSYFKQTRIVIDTLQNHYRFILNTLPHLYYTGTTGLSRLYHFQLYINSQNYYFVSVLVSSFQIGLKSIIFVKISMSCFPRKNMVSPSFWKCHVIITKKSVSNREMIIIDFGAHVNRGLCMQYSSLMSRKH